MITNNTKSPTTKSNETKLFIPTTPGGALARLPLYEKLTAGLDKKLILVVGPAGCGKTTLISEWIRASDNPSTVWISLDNFDNDPVKFIEYLALSLNKIQDNICPQFSELASMATLPPMEHTLSILVYEIGKLDKKILMVFDDFHVIKSDSVQHAVSFLIQHAPPNLSVLLASRSEPNLGIARLRAYGDIVEITPADLMFTIEEAQHFLSEIMNVNIESRRLERIFSQTEGWITGIKLVALASQSDTPDTDYDLDEEMVISGFLFHEALQSQTETVREFLYQTALLERFNGELCNYVLKAQHAQDLLELLERSNLFIVPLDNRRHWYRYHHLFSQVLSERIINNTPSVAKDIFLRASEWFNMRGHIEEAIHYALLSKEYSYADELFRTHHPEYSMYGKNTTILGWLKQFPPEYLAQHPDLSISYGWALIEGGRHSDVEPLLIRTEQYLADSLPNQTKDTLYGEIAVLRSSIALHFGDLEQTMRQSRQALAHFGQQKLRSRCAATGILGIVYTMRKQLQLADETLSSGLQLTRQFGSHVNNVWMYTNLAYVKTRRAKLHRAESLFKEALSYIKRCGLTNHPSVEFAHLGIAEVYYLQNKLREAEEHIHIALKTGKLSTGEWLSSSYILCAKIALAKNDTNSAEQALDNAIDTAGNHSDKETWNNDLLVIQTDISIRLNQTARSQTLLNKIRSCGANSFYRALCAAKLAHAMNLTQKARRYVRTYMDNIHQQEDMVLTLHAYLNAVVILAKTQHSNVSEYLTEAVFIGADETLLTPFLQHQDDLIKPLLHYLHQDPQPPLSHLDFVTRIVPDNTNLSNNQTSNILSDRESEVIMLIHDGATNQDIASALDIKISTVKTHVSSIFEKLGVKNRTQAILRATDIGIISK